MQIYIDTLELLMNESFFETALLLGELLFLNDVKPIIEDSSFETKIDELSQNNLKIILFLLEALKKCKYYKRILSFIESNCFLLDIMELENIYNFALANVEKNTAKEFITKNSRNITINRDYTIKLSPEIRNLYFKEISNAENCDYKILIDTFYKDERNFEILKYLVENEAISNGDLLEIFNKMKNNNLKKIYRRILNSCDYMDISKFNIDNIYSIDMSFFSPETGLKLHNFVIKHNRVNLSVFMCAFLFRNFDNDYRTYISICHFYLLKGSTKLAHKAISEALYINKNIGPVHRSCGFVFSQLNDPNTAVLCFKKAKNKMPYCWISSVGAALEYKRLNEEKNAHFYYLESLNNNEEMLPLFYYGRFLFEIQDLKSFTKILCKIKNNKKTTQDKFFSELYHIYTFFDEISRNSMHTARDVCNKIENRWKKKICIGYLFYIEKDYVNTVENIFEAYVINPEESLFYELIKISLIETPFRDRSEYTDVTISIFMELTKELNDIKYLLAS
ncbi:hypothetical protein EDEG_00338 [Edhazardia aedis USNM 41457]|uniref:Uncharacterized protein n=1 Tax=Edhazardia aedis (strain USNM 41457) TaxID=1003232 RepID=J9D1W2_EDHAE|nr:hypothetical protein EDEG_00338 [Edhazardia aedis USNM 41457]|eukprot:EJW01851.1 hypothetical protein EDEG_00338 [Edhazardia aedis USNM 41457]